MEVEDRFDKIMETLEQIEAKLRKKVEEKDSKVIDGKKNTQLHMMIETSLMNKLRKESNEKRISLAELVRQKLRENNQLDRIEMKLDKFFKK